MRGGKPKPNEMKVKAGSRHASRTVVVGGRKAPPMPKGLSKVAQAAWKELVRDMMKAGILDAADGPLVEIAAVLLARMRQARAEVEKHGPVIEGARGTLVKSPYLLIEERSGSELRLLMEQLGIGPVGRSRLGLLSKPGLSMVDAMNATVGPRALTVVKN